MVFGWLTDTTRFRTESMHAQWEQAVEVTSSMRRFRGFCAERAMAKEMNKLQGKK
jgi:hypothetical protein